MTPTPPMLSYDICQDALLLGRKWRIVAVKLTTKNGGVSGTWTYFIDHVGRLRDEGIIITATGKPDANCPKDWAWVLYAKRRGITGHPAGTPPTAESDRRAPS